MVNDLLDLAKVEAGRIEVKPTEFQLNDLLNALRGVLKPLLAANRSLELVIEPADDIPAMYSDDAKVAQILRNFISNAIKFTEKGEVRVSSHLSDDGTCVIIAVSDTGIGIAKENLPLVFEEFAQVDSPLQRKVKGTGLGLPLAKKFASLLGGAIQVESELGHGSTFTVELPLSIGHREQELPSIAEVDESEEAAFRRVLLVDDDPQHRYVLRTVLGGIPEVIEADSVHAGFAAAKEHRPELIFIDLIMQGASGFDLIRMLDANPDTRRIPRIVNTSKLLNDEERDFLEANAVGVLDKRTLTAAEGKMAMHRALARATAQAKSA
jgi:CheY-like chemotaxis protein